MAWSWKIARIAGIDVNVHATFLLLVAWFAYLHWQAFGTLSAVAEGVVYIIALFSCVVLHEFGHALTAQRYNVVTRSITLLPIGGVAAMEKLPENPVQEIKIALAGPAVNVVIATLLWIWLNLNGIHLTDGQILDANAPFLLRLMVVNILLVVFNLLPAFPMDGGRVLRALLAMRLPHNIATEKAATIGQNIAVLLGILGLFYNPFLILIAVFLWFGANAENQAEQIKHSLAGATASDAMLTEFHLLSPRDQLSKAISLTLAGSQKDFPVGGHYQIDGVLTQNQLITALQNHGENIRVGELPLQEIITTPPETPVQQLIEEMQGETVPMIAVINSEGRTLGIVNLDNIMELIKIQAALNAPKSKNF